MKIKIKVAILVFIISLFSIANISRAQTMGELTRLAESSLNAFFSRSIEPYTNGNTDGGREGSYAYYCMDPFSHGSANHGNMRTAVVDVGFKNISSVNNLSTTNSEGARRAMEVLYYATKSYQNREPWGKTSSSPYRLMMMQTSAMYSNVIKNAGLFNSGLPGGVTESYMIMQFGSNRYRQLKNEGEAYVNSTKNFAFADKSTQKIQTIEEVGDWIFIGPYVIENNGAGYTYGAEVTTYTGNVCIADGWAYSPNPNGVYSMRTNITSGSTFYLAFKSQKPDSAKKVTLYKKTDMVLKARMVFYESVGGQNLATYGGEIGSTTMSISLPEVPFSYIKVTKTEEHSGNPIPNVGFIVSWKETEDSETIKWVQDGTPAKLVDSRENATVYKTDVNGLANVRNLNKKGYYTVYEVVNGNFGFEDTSYDNPCIVVESNIKAVGQLVKLNLSNERKYIKLSGYVWEDMISEKQSVRNWLYNRDDNDSFDKLIANMTVSLRDKNGNLLQAYNDEGQPVGTIQPRKTNSEGKYEFGNYWAKGYETEKIRIDDIVDGAYIEFEYNGMSYKSVPLFHTLGLDNSLESKGSRITDDTNRSRSGENNQYFYSTRYATVTSSEATDTEGRVTRLEYDFTNNRSTLKFADDKSNYIYGYDGQAFPIDGIYDKYKTFANTKDANNGIMGKGLTENDIYKNNMEEIPYINLGLYEREMPDLAVMQDIENARITLNGYEHLYGYDQRFADDGIYKEDGFNVSVKFGEKYSTNSYTREIYSSDLVYNGLEGGEEGKLGVYITYKIAINNQATSVYTNLDKITNYYDSRYTIEKIGTQVEGNDSENSGEVIGIDELTRTMQTETLGNGYNKAIIDLNSAGNIGNINPVSGQNNTIYIYIKYKLNNEAVNTVLNGEITGESTLKSVTEVTSYSLFENGFNTVYSGVDRDSRPDSILQDNPNDRTYYEDDTDLAPALQVISSNTRIIQGTVWEDSNEVSENTTGYEKRREGNGKYETDKENVISGVQVDLINLASEDQSVATLYKTDDNGVKPATYTTESDGTYRFDGVIPGEYLLRYTYSNGTTKIVDTNGNETSIEVSQYKSTKYRNYKSTLEDDEDEDNFWYRRETLKFGVDRLSDAKDKRGRNEDGKLIDDLVGDRIADRTYNYDETMKAKSLSSIESETKRFTIDMEHDVNQDMISQYGADLRWEFDNIDFGIIRRPIQDIKVTKKISKIEIVLANGQTIISGNPSEDFIEHLRYLPDEDEAGGIVYIEIDNEIIQGAVLNVEYEIEVDLSNSEVDFNDREYYNYNKLPENYNDQNGPWKMATVSSLYDYVADDLNFDEKNQEVGEKGELIYGWKSVEVSQEQIENGELSQEVFDQIKNYTKILDTDYFATMHPGERTRTAKLHLSRVLSNNELDFTFDNDVEVHTVPNRPPDESIPGNHVPGDTPQYDPDEPDEDQIEIIITGPTGENKQYLRYTVLIISISMLFVTGIILIKKKIIGKKI